MTAEEIICGIEQLTPEERQKVTDYISTAIVENEPLEPFELMEDDDVGLEEDLTELDKNLAAYDPKESITHEELVRLTQNRLRKNN